MSRVSVRTTSLAACVAWALALTVVGCQTDEPTEGSPVEVGAGSLAALAPATSEYYAELVLRPDDPTMRSLTSVLQRLGEGEEGIERLRSGLLESIGGAVPVLAQTPDYEQDVEPWLGERLAVFAEVARPGSRAAPEPAFAIGVSDAELAEESLTPLLAEGLETTDGPAAEGVLLFAEQPEEGTAIALTEGALLLGPTEHIEQALDSESAKLGNQPDFETALRDIDIEQGGLGFLVLDAGDEIEAAFRARLGGFADAFGVDPLARLGIDVEQPLSAELGVAERSIAVETSFGLLDDPGIDQLRTLVNAAPRSSSVAIGDPVVLPYLAAAVEAGVRIGLRRAGDGDIAAGTEVVKARLGFDPLAAIGGLTGPYGFYVSSVSSGDVALGARATTTESLDGAAVIDLVSFLAPELLADVRLAELPLEDGSRAVLLESKRLPYPIAVADQPKGVELAAATSAEAHANALDPTPGFLDDGRLLEAETKMSGDYFAIGYANLPVLSIALGYFVPQLGVTPLRINQGGELAIGGLYERKHRRLSLRFVVDPPRLPEGGGPLDQLPGSEDEVAPAAADDADSSPRSDPA